MPTSLRVTDFENVVFFTGAGMSAESGVPTYRGKGGIWKQYNYEDYACQQAFDRDPARVWEFHNYRRDLVSKCAPNDGHRLIARCEQRRPKVTVVTQNIDGLHQQAGSRNVLELHGSLWRVRCDACGWRADSHAVPLEELRCPECGGWKRPDIVWFGDSLFPDVLAWVDATLSSCDLLVAVGTSAVVYPAAQMPLLAKQAGATLIEVNPEATPLSPIYDNVMRGPATEMLAQLCEGIG